MKEIVLITGANGMIAKELSRKLEKYYELRFLTRKKKAENEFEWNIENAWLDENALLGVDHIIHLAGANIAEKQWTETRKREIISSRVDSARLLLNVLKRNQQKISSFISASAVGFYGSETSAHIYTETDTKGAGFLSDVVEQWEAIADSLLQEGVAGRVVKIRTAVVLSKNGGALTRMSFPLKYCLGAVLGSGKQYIPWIHICDLCAIYLFVLRNLKMKGVYNACSPIHVTNRLFTNVVAETLHKPLFLPSIPSAIIKLVFGESSFILLNGSRVSSEKIVDEGFRFEYPDLKQAVRQIVKDK